MPTERFTKAEFEAALPDGLWLHRGVVGREFVYAIPVHGNNLQSGEMEVRIHSSVNSQTHVADGTGENSIRTYLYAPKLMKALGKGNSRWTTRVSGWQGRMLKQLRELYGRGQKSSRCACGELQAVLVAKTKANKGRKFLKCLSCGEWGKWVD